MRRRGLVSRRIVEFAAAEVSWTEGLRGSDTVQTALKISQGFTRLPKAWDASAEGGGGGSLEMHKLPGRLGDLCVAL